MMRARTIGVAALLAACTGQDLDIGHDSATSGSAGTASGAGMPGTADNVPTATLPTQTGCATDPELAGLVGIWDGTLDDYYLNPIEHLHVVINGASSQGVCGTVTWGTHEGPPPATDPDALYPPAEYWQPPATDGAPGYPPIEGFAYSITNAGERLPTLRLGYQPNEPWKDWCALQTPVFSAGSWACAEQLEAGGTVSGDPNTTCTVENSNGTTSYINFKCMACWTGAPTCDCDESGCALSAVVPPESFDLELVADGQSLTGAYQSMSWVPPPWGYVQNTSIHLERVQ